MKIILSTFLVLLFTSSLSAQYRNNGERFIVGMNAGVVNPMGDFADESKLGIDLSLNAKILLNPKIAVGISVGYMDFGQNDDYWNGYNIRDYTVNYQVIPIVFTASYFIKAYDLDFRPYASLGFGYFLYRNHVESTAINIYNADTEEHTVFTGHIGLTPNVGFLYNLSKKLAADVNLKLTYIPNFEDKLEKKNVKPSFPEGAQLSDPEKYYYLGFDKITSLSLTVGLYYRL